MALWEMFAYCITDMLKKETTKKKYNNMCGDELANLKICSFWVIKGVSLMFDWLIIFLRVIFWCFIKLKLCKVSFHD